jgi:hypothetical protein
MLTDKQLEEMAAEAGLPQKVNLSGGGVLVTPTAVLRRFAEAVMAKERERCASICDGVREASDYAAHDGQRKMGAMASAASCAKLIRSR